MAKPEWDVVIVGAGSAGSVLAARLSEQTDKRILLIEAGSAPENSGTCALEISSAGIVAGARAQLPVNWLVPGWITDTRQFTATRGRVLGGSSSTNGGYFIRPRRSDFLRWMTSGTSLWGYDHALPFLRGMENDLTFGSTPIHGDAGPVPVTHTSDTSAAARTFVDAAHELGIGDHLDMNDEGDEGVGPVPTNTRGDVQFSAAMSYLEPARGRKNLSIWPDAVVKRVLFSNKVATGVRVRRGGESIDVSAGEVVLCAGALSTPQLLMLSGIGPTEQLTKFDIPVILDSPGVGQGLSDHPQIFGMWMPTHTDAPTGGSWMGGVLHTEHDGSAIEIILSEVSLPELVGDEPNGTHALLVAPITPRRTGEVVITSASIDDAPTVYYKYLADADVRADLRAAARLTHAMLATAAIGENAQWTWGPSDAEVADDALLDAWIAENVGTSMHACATASFAGPNPVVDPHGRVLGVTGLRVADTSILPAAPSRGPAVAAMLVGEIIAATIKAESE